MQRMSNILVVLIIATLVLTLSSAENAQMTCTSAGDGENENCVQNVEKVSIEESPGEDLTQSEDNEDEDEDDEISSELDELIRLQQLKLDLLMKSRGGKGKNKNKKKARVSESEDAGAAMSSGASIPQRHHQPSHEQPQQRQQYQQHRQAFTDLRALDAYLAPLLSLQTGYSIAAHHLLQVRVVNSGDGKRTPPREVLLVLVLDTASVLHILDARGTELQRTNLRLFHKKEVLVTDVEAHSEMGPIFVSGAKDGSVNVLSILVEASGHDVAVSIAEVSNFNIRVVKKYEKKQEGDRALPYPTSMHLYNRGSQRGMGIYVGDSYCRFSIFALNSSLVGRVGVTVHPASSALGGPEHEKSGLQSAKDQYECGPGEEGGLGSMSRVGQVMAIPVGKAIMLLHIARLYLPPRVCLGSSEVIRETAFDLTSLTYLMATTSSGALLTFNTKAKDDRGKDVRCSLMRMVPGQQQGGKEQGGKQLVSLKGYMLHVGASGQGKGKAHDSCRMSVFNTSDIKQHREGSLLSSQEISSACNGESLAISTSPKNLRDQSIRYSSSDVLVAVAHDVSGSGDSDAAAGGVINVYTSLLLPIEPEDELAWLKLPMAVGGVLVFVLFKMFGPGRKAPKSNTSGGTHSKYGKYNSRFSGGSGGDGVNASELQQLRDKLSEIENSVNHIDSAGNDLLKKFTTNRYKGKYN